MTLIVATRGAISLNLPDRNIPFLLSCVAMDTIVPLNSTQEDRGQKRPRKGNGKGQMVQNKEEAVARLATLLAKQVLKNSLGWDVVSEMKEKELERRALLSYVGWPVSFEILMFLRCVLVERGCPFRSFVPPCGYL